MNNYQIQQALLKKGLLSATCFVMLFFLAGCQKFFENPTANVSTIVTGLNDPMGIEITKAGDILVAETGTTHNDGKIVMIRKEKAAFQVYDVVVNLSSIKNALSDEAEGPAHMLLDGSHLYVLAGDYFYTIDLRGFRPGDAPIDASVLQYEDMGSWVRDQEIVTPNDSHPYDLVKGPDGKIYIVDAGANAIIKRNSENNYSVFATFPDLKNPTPVGPPSIQSVPTGIIFDGHRFLVSTLTGFPFPEGQAVVYEVSTSGRVSLFAEGFTTLTGIAEGNIYGHILLSHGTFGQQGFEPASGSMFSVKGDSKQLIAGGLNMPSAFKQVNDRTWYVSSLGDGAVLKVSY